MHSMVVVPGIMELVVLWGMMGGGLPLGVPPAPEDPMMARVAPEQCLFYTTWSGMAAPDAASTNQLEQLLAEPEIQHFFTALERQIMASIRKAVKKEEPAAVPLVDEIAGWVKMLLTHPAAMFVSELKMSPRGPEIRGGVLVHVGPDAAKLKTWLVSQQAALLRGMAEQVEIQGKTWYRLRLDPDAPEITWGTKGEYLVVGVGHGNAEKILARMETPSPEWLTRLRRRLPVERVSTVSYVNLKMLTSAEMGMPIPAEVFQAFGLDNVSWLASVSGLDRQDYVTRTLLATDGEPRGMLGTMVEGRLSARDLAVIPADATVAVAAKIDAGKVFDAFLSVLEQLNPRGHAYFTEALEYMESDLDINLRGDVLGTLGDTWRVYSSPGEGGLLVTGLTGVVDVRNRPRLATAHGKWLATLRAELTQHEHYRTPRIEQFKFAGHDVFFFDSRDDDFLLAPAWCLTDKELIVAAMPQNVKAYLSRGKDFKSLGSLSSVAEQFSSSAGPVVFARCDTRQVFDVVYPLVPIFVQAVFSDLHREGIDLKISMLPSAPAIRKHLRPSVCTLRKTDAGIESIRRQTIPLGSAVVVAPMVSFVMLGELAARDVEIRMIETSRNRPVARPEKARPSDRRQQILPQVP